MQPIEFKSYKNGQEHIFFFIYNQEFHTDLKYSIYRCDIWQEGVEPTIILLKIMPNDKDLKVIDNFPAINYKGKGMSIAFILQAKKHFCRTIISSSKNFPDQLGEDRWLDAENYVWKRMVLQNLASYNPEKDYYYTL